MSFNSLVDFLPCRPAATIRSIGRSGRRRWITVSSTSLPLASSSKETSPIAWKGSGLAHASRRPGRPRHRPGADALLFWDGWNRLKEAYDPTAASLTQPQGAASPGRPGGAPPAVAPKPRTPTPKPPQAAPGPERPSRWVAHRRRAHRAKRNDVAFPEPPSARPRAGRQSSRLASDRRRHAKTRLRARNV